MPEGMHGDLVKNDREYMDQVAAGSEGKEFVYENAIEPEGLTPGVQSAWLENWNDKAQAESIESGAVFSEAEQQMEKLLEQKIAATLAGDEEGAKRINAMIKLHCDRNNLPYSE